MHQSTGLARGQSDGDELFSGCLRNDSNSKRRHTKNQNPHTAPQAFHAAARRRRRKFWGIRAA